MEDEEVLLLELVSTYRNELFNKKRTKFAVKRRQDRWERIHEALVNKGYVSPFRLWTRTRQLWYRMVRRAKTSHRQFTAGTLDHLNDDDKKVLSLLNIPLDTPKGINRAKGNLVVEESQMRIERIELLEDDDDEFSTVDLSQMSDLELKKGLLQQEYKLNEFKLLKIKYGLMNENNKTIRDQYLRQLEMQ